jgi:hypothetical protein
MTVYTVMYEGQNLSNPDEPAHTALMRVFSTQAKADAWIEWSTGRCCLGPGEDLWVDAVVVDATEEGFC